MLVASSESPVERRSAKAAAQRRSEAARDAAAAASDAMAVAPGTARGGRAAALAAATYAAHRRGAEAANATTAVDEAEIAGRQREAAAAAAGEAPGEPSSPGGGACSESAGETHNGWRCAPPATAALPSFPSSKADTDPAAPGDSRLVGRRGGAARGVRRRVGPAECGRTAADGLASDVASTSSAAASLCLVSTPALLLPLPRMRPSERVELRRPREIVAARPRPSGRSDQAAREVSPAKEYDASRASGPGAAASQVGGWEGITRVLRARTLGEGAPVGTAAAAASTLSSCSASSAVSAQRRHAAARHCAAIDRDSSADASPTAVQRGCCVTAAPPVSCSSSTSSSSSSSFSHEPLDEAVSARRL